MSELAQYMTIKEAAARYDVSVRTIRRWIAAGKFPQAYQLQKGRTSAYRIPMEDIEAYEQRQGIKIK